ncbi:MAG: penicillin-binding transpeptidase domain-containing protein [Lachnospiraceae bacterium]|jgi:penicillin-binding protein 2
MVKRLIRFIKKLKLSRTAILAVVFTVLAGVLISRLYNLQIIKGAEYRDNFTMKTTKTRTIKSTRGNIYDRNGELLAYNELSYDLTIEDNGTYDSTREKQLALNGEAYQIYSILTEHGDRISQAFHVYLDENGEYAYDTTGTSLMRFKADIFGHANIDDLEPEEENASAEEMMDYLISEKRFAVIRKEKPYTNTELVLNDLPLEFTKEELLNIVKVRYALFTTSYQKYIPVTIATDISDTAMAELTERKAELPGIEIVENTKRVYNDAEYFASIIGYTGIASADDLAEFQQISDEYNSTSIVGKSGIERVMETTLQGSDGQETVYVDNLGKVLEIDEARTINSVAGNDVYLTIDKELQINAYKILEQRIAGILLNVIVDAKETQSEDEEITDTESVRIASYDVYNALINNNIVDTGHFTAPDASSDERFIQQQYEQKQAEIFAEINKELTSENTTPYNQLSKEMKEYESYIVNDLLTDSTGILNSSAIDTTDETYLAWSRDESISLKDYLKYAASQNWIDISSISSDETYLDSNQVYAELSDYIKDYLSTDKAFGKILYKYLLFEDRISGKQILSVLYDQGVLNKEDTVYEGFMAGEISAFDTLSLKIRSLEITPAMLALDPCSGSAVVTDPNNGQILACVTYPGYDNNRLANTMDFDYYKKIASDLSGPLYNKATQARTAPGSTFKLVTTVAGLSEGVIGNDTVFDCTGTFDLTETPLNCWYLDGHGKLDLLGGIENSCNVYFCNVAYEMGINEEATWSDSLSLQKLQAYSCLFDLDKPSGIEIPEAEPQVSDKYAIQSAIGQGTHLYTTTQIARYVSTLANSGTSYNISLIGKITDHDGNVIMDYSPSIQSELQISDSIWETVHEGMRDVIKAKEGSIDFGVEVAGKTGTAQESKSRPSHALFMCYAPYNNPEISMAVRINHGYSSTNCVLAANDILSLYFGTKNTEDVITGLATTEGASSEQVD